MKKLIAGIVSLMCSGALLAQVNLELQTKKPFYINANSALNSQIYDIQDGFLSIEYLDNIGKAKEIILKIYDWKMQALGNYALDKSLGLNHYSFDLADIAIKSELGAVYRCVIEDENKNKYEWTVRNTKRPEDNKPVPAITVNPIHVGCDNLMKGNLVEFHGQINGGNAPFVLNWYVINEARTEFLYQPKEEKAANVGVTSIITVDKNPVYNVMLLVTDACGNSGKQMVTISCQQSDKKIHTLFVEPIEKLNAHQRIGN